MTSQPQKGPHATVAIPTRNRALKLVGALDALAASVLPPGVTVEIVVVDNGSTDHTPEVVSEAAAKSQIPIHYHFEPRKGISNARNRAINVARSPLMLFTDDDCRPAEDWIAKAIDLFRSDPRLAIAGGTVCIHDAEDSSLFATYTFEETRLLRGSDYLTHIIMGANMCARTASLRLAGGFDQRLGVGSRFNVAAEEFDMVYRLVEAGEQAGFYPELVVSHAHGRQTDEEVKKAFCCYHAGYGAMVAKHGWRDLSLLKHAYWALRRFARNGEWAYMRHFFRGFLARLLPLPRRY